VLAAQIRSQGFACDEAQKAKRDASCQRRITMSGF
jgi:hypothetical protein